MLDGLFNSSTKFKKKVMKKSPTLPKTLLKPVVIKPNRLIDMRVDGRYNAHNVVMLRRITKNYYRGFIFCDTGPAAGDMLRLGNKTVMFLTEVAKANVVDDGMYRFVARYAKMTFDDNYGRQYGPTDMSEYRWADEGYEDKPPKDFLG